MPGIFSKLSKFMSGAESAIASGKGSELMSFAKHQENLAFHPDNPGWKGVYRTIPVVQQPSYATSAQATLLKSMAAAAEKGAANAEEALKAAEKIEEADARVHTAYREYQTTVAKKHDEKVAANYKYAQALTPLQLKRVQRQQALAGEQQNVDAWLAGAQQWQQQVKAWMQ